MTEQQADYKAGLDMPEAPACLNFRGTTQKGWDVQFTLRDWSEDALLARFGAFVKRLEEAGVTPPGQLTHHSVPAPLQQPSLASATPNELPQVTGSPAPQKAEELSFEAETLVGSMSEGKRFWKVKGGKFAKFGVTIWPEAARESNIDLDAADISKAYPLPHGMVAHYILNDKGQPAKVTRLVQR
jgi:hypothetical protein